MSRVKIAFVGVGGMGQCAHLKNYVTLPECEVVAIAEVREELGRRVAARYGVPRVYRSHEELLANEKPDGIVASQQFTRHGVIVPELLRAGVPLFTEKPLAGTIAAGERILEALAASDTWHMVGYHKRSDPATMYARAEIDRLKETGELGKLRYVRLLMPAGDWVANGFSDLVTSEEPLPPLAWDPPAADMDEATFQEYLSFVNYYIHQVNLMRHLLGEPYRVTYADPSGVMLAVQSESGVAGVLEMTPYRTTIDWQESALVAFERGYVKLELPAPLASNRPGRVEILSDPGDGTVPRTVVPTLPWVHAMRQQAMNFVAAIRGERKPPCEAAEALEDLKVAREYIRLLKGV
ncbi:MAG: Gfo/Idh/MocA family oxidoreductase [Armatimonadetes bacterium]|jgi:predicted dehydrogenase|nr:Gfo/Idh/MocA family oxidoreductase [Armatimonadota bacterium]